MIRHILLILALSLLTVTALANPWQTAVEKNDIEELTRLFTQDPEKTDRNGPALWFKAALLEHTQVLDWLLKNKIAGSDARYGDQELSIWRMAFGKKLLKTAQWLVTNKITGMIDRHGVGPWGLAAGCEFVEMLDWLRDQNIPQGNPTMIWRSAFSNGRVLSLRWLFENHIIDAPHEDGRNLWLFAATFDHTDTLDWALQTNMPGRHGFDREGKNMWLLAATFGNLSVLKWLHQNDKENFANWEPEIRSLAVEFEHYHITTWLNEISGAFDPIRALIANMAGSLSH